MALPNVNATQVAKVTQFIKDTTSAIMATTTSVPSYVYAAPSTEVVPLHFVREAVIEDQHYILELHKEQGSLWLKELNVIWVPEKDVNAPEETFCTIVTNNGEEEHLMGCGDRGFYQVVCETSENNEYFVRLHVYRL